MIATLWIIIGIMAVTIFFLVIGYIEERTWRKELQEKLGETDYEMELKYEGDL